LREGVSGKAILWVEYNMILGDNRTGEKFSLDLNYMRYFNASRGFN
jgi:hypothetical protein